MRLRKVKYASEFLTNSKFVIDNPFDYKSKWNELFNNNNQILHIEIGTGKGRFIHDLASLNPCINFIGIEKFESVLVRATERLHEKPLENLKLLSIDALELLEVFDKEEVDTIYLNFSDPWPKKRHAKRRLTSKQFLDVYKVILKNKIIMKTDNLDLFNYSIVSFNENNFLLSEITNDLHSLGLENVMTEYEEKFSSKCVKINKLIAKKGDNNK